MNSLPRKEAFQLQVALVQHLTALLNSVLFFVCLCVCFILIYIHTKRFIFFVCLFISLFVFVLFYSVSYPQIRKQLMDNNGFMVMKDLYFVQDQLM